MSDGGKGSKKRLTKIPEPEFEKKWSSIFGKSPLERRKEREAQRADEHDALTFHSLEKTP